MQFYRAVHQASDATLIPFYSSSVSAGFPSPAEDHCDEKIDLHQLLITHPAATFFARAEGNSMIDAGILSGDLLIVDRALKPVVNDIVLAFYDGGYLVKRLIERDKRLYLAAENHSHTYQPILVTEEVMIWGVVSGVARSTRSLPTHTYHAKPGLRPS